jgi:predicted glycosyltransferase
VTVRDHGQTLALARRWCDDLVVVGDQSPSGRAAKGRSIAGRAAALRRLAARERPDVALSHNSYAQLVAARWAGIPAVTMMDYEHQPANHLAFRLAGRALVPEAFPDWALRRYGAARKAVRYPGFKEQLYLAAPAGPPERVGLDRASVIAVLRPPPEGALYHRRPNQRFDDVLDHVRAHPETTAVMLPRNAAQRARYRGLTGVVTPEPPPDGAALLRCADLAIGAGGTMTREAALVGIPAYTVFAGRLAAVDAELMRQGRVRDLRPPGTYPVLEKRPALDPAAGAAQAAAMMEAIVRALGEAARA